MKNLFAEPCPGCFENRLRELSEVPGGAVFLGAGDFTLSRILTALGKLANGGEVIISTYRLEQSTIDTLSRLIREATFAAATILYDVIDIAPGPIDHITTVHAAVRAFIVTVRNDTRQITITGMFAQDTASHSLECFAMINDPEQQRALSRHLSSKAARPSPLPDHSS